MRSSMGSRQPLQKHVPSRMMNCKFVLDCFWRITATIKHVRSISNRLIRLDQVTRVHCQPSQTHRRLTCRKVHCTTNHHRGVEVDSSRSGHSCRFPSPNIAMPHPARWVVGIQLLVRHLVIIFMTLGSVRQKCLK